MNYLHDALLKKYEYILLKKNSDFLPQLPIPSSMNIENCSSMVVIQCPILIAWCPKCRSILILCLLLME